MSDFRLFLLFLCICCVFPESTGTHSVAAPPTLPPAPAPAPVAAPLQLRILPPDEIDALKRIAFKLKIEKWNFSLNPCDGGVGWYEDTKSTKAVGNLTCGDCNNHTCHVTSIMMKSQNLTGVLPPDLADLKFLVNIDLSRNYIGGSIPPRWGSSARLLNISLGGNQISGQIPKEIGNITTLNSLVLENNLLQGPIPDVFGSLKNLTRLIISANDFTGQLPTSMGYLVNLIDLRIDGSGISGKIPIFIGNLTSLKTLHMQGTNMEGPFPSTFKNLANLSELRVSDLNLGIFPPLENMTLMKILMLRNCSISGVLPEYIRYMTSLKVLDLSFNNFTGEIPDSYRTLDSSITNMYLTENMLTGTIPKWIIDSKMFIDISYNYFDDSSAPSQCIQQGGTRVNVFSSCLSSNGVKDTCLMKNYPCPGTPTNYKLFINCGGGATNIGDNQYEEDKAVMGASTFFVSKNKTWAFSSTGDYFGNKSANYIAKNNTILNMSNPEIYMEARLSPSSLKYYALCLQKGSYTVGLHFAEIVFINNNTFYSVGRRLFDVSIQGDQVLEDFNIVAAANGTGQAIILNFTAVVENGTLEIAFRWSGKGTSSIPDKGIYGPLISAISVTPNFEPEIGTLSNTTEKGLSVSNTRKRGLSIGAIVGIVAAGCMLMLVIFLILWFCKKQYQSPDNGLQGVNLHTSKFSLREIISATGNFSRESKIGEGGFGSVFKGTLSDGTLIAVKQLSSKSKQGNREFIAEVGIISGLEHENLVKLLGCCIEGNQMLLVYEYMENNSLHHILLDPEEKRLKLNWPTRQKICLGIARGLAYLHDSRLKIVHRDIKLQNVLLDKDLNAKISDFGLAKLYELDEDSGKTHMTATRVAGTTGYMAPEYVMKGHVTDKTDVYAFGIVLLEVVSGRLNLTPTRDKDKASLLEFANELEESGNLLQLVDEILGRDYSQEEATQLIKLALVCTSSNPSQRPAMTTVVRIMERGELVQVPDCNGKLKTTHSRMRTMEELFGMSTTVVSTSATSSTSNPTVSYITMFNEETTPR